MIGPGGFWIWFLVWALFLTVGSIIKPDFLGKGRVTKLAYRLTKWRIVLMPWAWMTRAMVALIAQEIMGSVWRRDIAYVAYWAVQFGFAIDDYLYDDDSFKRLWEGVRNKVKWKMKLQPQPQETRT